MAVTIGYDTITTPMDQDGGLPRTSSQCAYAGFRNVEPPQRDIRTIWGLADLKLIKKYILPHFCLVSLISEMGRCGQCPSCVVVFEFRASNKKNCKKIKKCEYANPCVNPTTTNSKRKISEVEALFAAGHDGEIRGEFGAVPVPSTDGGGVDRATRKARPSGSLLEEPPFDYDAYDEYADIIRQCTQASNDTQCRGVKEEARTMIPKMRKLLAPQAKSEVDFREATKDASNILAKWSNDDVAGTRAFIPDLQFRDNCYAALKIFACAQEEAKQIPIEYIEMFGDGDGIGMYNQLLEIIGEQDKTCLPLVNMCLRAWLDKLLEDESGDIWADLSPLSFDKWKADAITNGHTCKHNGKTSYDMMIAVFGQQSHSSDSKFPAAAAADVPDPAKIQYPMFVQSSLHRKSKSDDAPTSATKPHNDDPNLNSKPLRTSRLMKLGEVLKKQLLYSRSQHLNRRITKANQEMMAAIKESGEGDLNLKRYRCCEDAARKMEDILFSVGDVERVVKTLQYFKDRAVVEELTLASRAMVATGDTAKYLSKDKKLSALVMDSL